MARYSVYNNSTNQAGTVSFVAESGYVSDTLSTELYLVITTSLRGENNDPFAPIIVRQMSDVPDGFATPTTFQELADIYIDWFVNGEPSSSSSSSSE